MSENPKSSLLNCALDALTRGFAVFPCYAKTKLPAGRVVPHGVLEATTSEEQIREWWKIDPSFNPAVTGGVIVDVDTNLNSIQEVKNFAMLNSIPATLMVRTGRRPEWGIQWHFTGIAENFKYCANSVTGEVRCWHEYGMAPGSIHPNGERYVILADLPRVPFPPDLLRNFRTEGASRISGTEHDAIDFESARERYHQLLFKAANAPKGRRNHRANNVAYYSARAFLAGVFEEWKFLDVLLLPRLTENEVKQQILNAVEPLYGPRERDIRKMLWDSWNSGIRAGRLSLDLYTEDFTILQSLTDDIRFQNCWDGDLSEFPDAVTAREFMIRTLTEAGSTDAERVLRASAFFDAVAERILFELRIKQLESET
jgi:hypothetical protein